MNRRTTPGTTTRRPGRSSDGRADEPTAETAADNRLAKLRILGKEVTIGCRPGEEDALKQAAAYIDASMRDLKARNTTSSLEKIAIVTAINTADALLKARAGQSGAPVGSVESDAGRPGGLKDRLAGLNAALAAALDDDADEPQHEGAVPSDQLAG